MSIYDITIAGTSGAAPSDGFIDPKTVYAYTNATATDKPTTYAASLAKARGNRRHKNVLSAVQFNSAIHIASVTPGGSPNANTAPTNIVYRVHISDINAISTPDESNKPAKLTGNAAVKRLFARALVRSESVLLEVLDPTTATAPGNSTPFARAAARFNIETVGALYNTLVAADSAVTITPVA